jgi:hypothetical protein
MEQVMLEVARREYPRVMSSTFRGRGHAAGQIYRPHLDCVEFVGDRPVRFHFVFHEALAPEIVRGRDEIGEVFSLLYLATRVRWEVLNPFLIRRVLSQASEDIPLDTRNELMAQISNSLRIIDAEAERHNMLHCDELSFHGAEAASISQLLSERRSIREAITKALTQGNFEELIEELKRALLLTCRVTDLLAGRYGELVREDRERVEATLAPEPRRRSRARRAAARTA